MDERFRISEVCLAHRNGLLTAFCFRKIKTESGVSRQKEKKKWNVRVVPRDQPHLLPQHSQSSSCKPPAQPPPQQQAGAGSSRQEQSQGRGTPAGEALRQRGPAHPLRTYGPSGVTAKRGKKERKREFSYRTRTSLYSTPAQVKQ